MAVGFIGCNKKIRFLFYSLTVIWMGVIFYLSHQTSSKSQGTSGSFIRFLLNLFNMENTPEKVEALQGMIRTVAHFGAFGLLGLLFFCSFVFSGRVKRLFLIPLCCTFVYAVTDEIHQIFVDGRAFQLSDILVDTLGGALAIFIGVLIFKIVIKYKERKN